ncbi:MAG: carboxymuconolactone decarboxylase family protein [Acidimicrobiia bacterium]
MARVKPLDPNEVPQLADLFAARRRGLGFVPNSALTIARWPELAEAYGALADAIASTRKLPPGLSSLIFLMASSAAGCEYCVAHGASKAVNKGVLESKLEAVWDFETSPLFDDAERAALRLALAAGVTPSAVTDEHFDDLRLHFDDDAIVEIVGIIAFSGFLNRWNATMGTTLEEQPRSVAERLLTAQGWDIGPHG